MSETVIPEIQIEREYDEQLAHARAMYHMAVQRAESELDAALAAAECRRSVGLAAARQARQEAARATVAAELAPYLPGVGVTRMSEIEPREA